MNRRDIFIGLIVIVLISFVFYWLRRPETPELSLPDTTESQMEELENSFVVDIPDDVEKTMLKDVTGGSSTGLGTRDLKDGLFIHTVLASLPEPEPGTFYEGWLVRGAPGDDNFHFISTGKMVLGKGVYMLEFTSEIDYPDYTGVVITLEEIEDATPEAHILEGSF